MAKNSPEFTVNGVPCTVAVDGGIVEGEPGGKPEATVVFKVAWPIRFDLVKALRGEVVWAGGSDFIRMHGFPYPDSPNMSCLEVTEVRPLSTQTMRTRGDGWVEYPYALVTAKFGTPEWGDEEFWSLRVGISGEFLTMPGTSWRFLGGNPVGAEIGRVLPDEQIEYTAHRLPFIPQEEIDPLKGGKVNATPYRIGRQTYATGRLLFVGANTESRASILGLEHDVTYSIVSRLVDWNKYLDPSDNSWKLVTSDGTLSGFTPYGYEDFSILPV